MNTTVKNIAFAAAAAFVLHSPLSYGDDGDLQKWVGTFADGSVAENDRGKSNNSFMKDAQVRKIISKIIPLDIFDAILEKELLTMSPIQKIGAYLTFSHCLTKACNSDVILLAIDIKASKAIILRYTWDRTKNEIDNYAAGTKCYSQGMAVDSLPVEVKAEFLSKFVWDYPNEDRVRRYDENVWIDQIKCHRYE